MSTSDLQLGQSQMLHALIEQAESRTRELRQVVDRIVELSPKDKGIQDLDQFVDVLLVKLSAASTRVARVTQPRHRNRPVKTFY
jgi:ribosomal protein L17